MAAACHTRSGAAGLRSGFSSSRSRSVARYSAAAGCGYRASDVVFVVAFVSATPHRQQQQQQQRRRWHSRSAGRGRRQFCRAQPDDDGQEQQQQQQQQQQKPPQQSPQQSPPEAPKAWLEQGQGLALATGAVSVLIALGYLALVQFLDTRGSVMLPAPPEAYGP